MSYTITTDALDKLYKQLKPKGVTMSALLAKACGVALARHPIIYAGDCHCHQNLSIACSSLMAASFCCVGNA